MACKCAAWIETVVSCVLISFQTNLLILYTVYACQWLASLNLSDDSYGNIIVYKYKYISYSFIWTARKPLQQWWQWQSHVYGFLVVVLPVLLLKLLYIISSVLCVCPILLCITCLARNWLEDHDMVLNKAYLICDHFENFFKGTVGLKSGEHPEHTECLQRAPMTVYVLHIIIFGFDI